MTKPFLFILTNFLALSLFGLNIRLAQTNGADDLKVMNGNYMIYFKKADLVSAISEIDKATNSDHSSLATSIKDKKITSIDLNSSIASDKLLINLLKSNLGAYLLSKGKATIFNGTKPIQEISVDESPEMVGMDGNAKVAIFFSEPNDDTPIFLGNLNTKLKK